MSCSQTNNLGADNHCTCTYKNCDKGDTLTFIQDLVSVNVENRKVNMIKRISSLFVAFMTALVATGCSILPQGTSSVAPVQTFSAPVPSSVSAPIPTSKATHLAKGWVSYNTSGISIALPEQWKVVNLSKDAIDSTEDKAIKVYSDDWAQAFTSASSNSVEVRLRLWATNQENNSVISVSYIDTGSPNPTNNINDLALRIHDIYDKKAYCHAEAHTSPDFNGMEFLRTNVLTPIQNGNLHQYQNVFILEGKMWLLICSVDEAKWDTYEPIFSAITDTFRIEE